jgi:hypothetical protein
MDKSFCLLITRCVTKALSIICMIVGIAAAQTSAEISSIKIFIHLNSVRIKTGGITASASLSTYADQIDCDPFVHMLRSALAMGILAIFCGVGGIAMGVVNKLIGNKVPPAVFVAVAGLEVVMAVIGVALIVATFNGEACDAVDMRNSSEANYDAGFFMYVIASFFIAVDLGVEVLAMLGLIGSPDAVKSPTATTAPESEANDPQ